MLTVDQAKLTASIFRAYDIRGIADETLTEEGVHLIGKALGTLVQELGEHQFILARDGRVSGPKLLTALSDGILSTGCDVIHIGMVPTPLLYYATHIFDEHSGAMLTGSHNPAEFNGLKIIIKGSVLSGEGLQSLYRRIQAARFLEGGGSVHEVDVTDRYINHLRYNIKLKKPLRIVIDAGNGVTGMIAPQLYRALGCDVEALLCEIDGRFPNHHPDPSQAENMQILIQHVKKTNADIGLAFDGDGDRLGIVTNKGNMINADRLLMLYAQQLLTQHPKAKIIYDVKCTNHLADFIRSLNGEPIMWKTGHSLIKAKLKELHAQLGGEMSGHFIFNDRWYGFDDALYAGARLLEILSTSDEDADSLFETLPNSVNTPELKLSVKEEEKFALMEQLVAHAHFKDAKEVSTLDGLRISFDAGWGLVRPSNTSAYLIFRFEAENETILKKIQQIFKEWILAVKPDLALPF